MVPRRVSVRWLAAAALLLPFAAVGCRFNEPVRESDFYQPVGIDQPLYIRVNSKAEMLVHGKWTPIYERSHTVDTWFAKQAERYRQAYEASNMGLVKETRLGKEVVLLPAEVIIEADSKEIKSGIINSMERRAKHVGFYKTPTLRALDVAPQPAPSQ